MTVVVVEKHRALRPSAAQLLYFSTHYFEQLEQEERKRAADRKAARVIGPWPPFCSSCGARCALEHLVIERRLGDRAYCMACAPIKVRELTRGIEAPLPFWWWGE